MVRIFTASKQVGKRIRSLRRQRGISQERLAFESGLNRAYVGYIERAERNPTLETIDKIAKVLRVSPKDLI